jgi:hypothetical protein
MLTDEDDDSSGIDKSAAGSFVKKYAVLSSSGKPCESNPRIHDAVVWRCNGGNYVSQALLLLTEDEDDSSGIERSDAGSFVKRATGKPKPRNHGALVGCSKPLRVLVETL